MFKIILCLIYFYSIMLRKEKKKFEGGGIANTKSGGTGSYLQNNC